MFRPRLSLLFAAAVLPVLALSSCGGDDEPRPTATSITSTTPSEAGSVTADTRLTPAPRSATKNTTRLDATDPTAVAAMSALTMYPSTAKDLRPDAVTFAGADDWRSILLASSFAAKPLGFPLLLVNGPTMPAVTSSALAQLQPEGSRVMNSAQGIRIGVSNLPADLRTRYLTSSTPAGLAREADRQLTKARGKASSRVLIVNSEDPASAAPAAAWAARSGDPILFTGKGTLPADTKAALLEHDNPRVYVLGGPDTINSFVVRSLQDVPGVTVFRIQPTGDDATASDLSIAFAKYSDRDFGFNYAAPGHGFVFAPTSDPISAMAASALSSAGTYGALLFVDRPGHVDPPLRSYLLDVQPGYDDQHPPTQGFYNRGWVIGPSTGIEVSTQARLDDLLEIVRTDDPNALGDAAATSTAPEATP